MCLRVDERVFWLPHPAFAIAEQVEEASNWYDATLRHHKLRSDLSTPAVLYCILCVFVNGDDSDDGDGVGGLQRKKICSSAVIQIQKRKKPSRKCLTNAK